MPARSVLMVRPLGFRYDEQTAVDNAYQFELGGDAEQQAMREFEAVVAALGGAGIGVQVFDGHPDTPDAVFPNNWFSTHEDGTLVLYPLRSPSRRGERRDDIRAWLEERYPSVLDLSHNELGSRFLEGTGSMVLDRETRVAYAAESGRTDPQLFRNWCADMDYEPVLFETEGRGGLPVYHTNVLMAVGSSFAVLCTECVINPRPVLSSLLAAGKEIVEITLSQMASFCGNVIELGGDKPGLLMSQTAHDAFRSDQLECLARHADPIVADLPTIERVGGGGIRCMVAELF